MASLLVTLPGRFTVSAFAAVMIFAIYLLLLLRTRTAASRIRLLVMSSICLVALMWGFSLLGKRPRPAPAQPNSTVASHSSPSARVAPAGRLLPVSSSWLESPRAVYGHSIVKGGIHSLGELLNVIATDPLAAQHYKGFDITHARFIRLDHNIMAYISYRVDGQGIYWSSKPELILAGEEVITDGTNFIRVRCGNMISYAPQSPAESNEPTDTDTIVETFTPFTSAPLAESANVPPGGTPNGTPGGTPPGYCCSTVGFTPPTFGTPITPNTPTGPGTPLVTVSVDEFYGHGAFYTLFATVLGLFLIRKLFA
jgi:hypothetical protein